MTRAAGSYLRRGSVVGVVSSGFAVKPAPLRAGVARLEAMGYRVRLGRHVLAREGYLAGDDLQRASDLDALMRDPEIDALWFARGGYGTARLLEQLPWRTLRRHPKPLIGYSDLTALFGAALDRTASPCLYAPVVTELGDARLFHAASLAKAVSGRALTLRFARRDVLFDGSAQGRIAGGNLKVLTGLCGTRFMPDLREGILFLEEIGEQTYRIDGMLNQLRLCGAFRGLRGVVLGSFIVPSRRKFPPDRELVDLFRENFAPLGIPVVMGLPAGHVHGKWTVPLGVRAVLDTRAGSVRFLP